MRKILWGFVAIFVFFALVFLAGFIQDEETDNVIISAEESSPDYNN